MDTNILGMGVGGVEILMNALCALSIKCTYKNYTLFCSNSIVVFRLKM